MARLVILFLPFILSAVFSTPSKLSDLTDEISRKWGPLVTGHNEEDDHHGFLDYVGFLIDQLTPGHKNDDDHNDKSNDKVVEIDNKTVEYEPRINVHQENNSTEILDTDSDGSNVTLNNTDTNSSTEQDEITSIVR